MSDQSDSAASARASRRGAIGLLLALALGVWCYAPALHAFFAQDDFAFLAMVRLLHQPWLLFVHDHFPASLYFRPLGVLLWWLVCALAGAAAWPQYAVNLALHLGCVAALYTLLQHLRRDAWLNAGWAALYAAHPLALGTALWLSDRFDLMTTLFALLALAAALAYVTRARTRDLTLLLLWIMLGLASKELGVVGAAGAFAAIAFASRAPLDLRRRITALVAIALLTLGWLAYRQALLTPIGDGGSPAWLTPAVFVQGAANWLRSGMQFLVTDPRVPTWGGWLLALAAAAWTASVAFAHRAPHERALRWSALVGLATLLLLPGLVQAPVAAKHLGSIDAGAVGFNLIVASRFFHLALAALIALLALAAAPLTAAGAELPVARRLCGAAVFCALVALAPVAQRIAHDHASETRRQIAPLRAAQDALDRSVLPAQACQVYFLQTASLPAFAGYSDALAKGLAREPARLAHCLVSTERPPYTYFVRSGSLQPTDYALLRPLALAGKPVPGAVVGDLEMRYLSLQPDPSVALPPQELFFEYRDGTFADVSAAVRAGERKIDFVVAKP